VTEAPNESDAASRPQTAPAELAKRIGKKYEKQVLAAEKLRINRLQPWSKTEIVPPDELTTVRNLKKDLDRVMRKACAENLTSASDYDKLVQTDKFQKSLQSITSGDPRTGTFVEDYGEDAKYEGEFLHGQRHGKGTYKFRGETYEGEWKWDQRHGFGTFTQKDGTQLRGNWEGGKPHGFMTVIDPKGTILYEGEYQKGKRHGLGRQLFDSGDMYDGGWKDGKLHDRGVYYFTNGDKLYGHWADGVYDGVGFFHYVDGSVSRRVYSKGRIMSVQDYGHDKQRFGRDLHREGMHKHTAHDEFPRDVWMLSTI